MRQEFAQVSNSLLVADVTVMGVMQKIFDPVQRDAEAGAMTRFDRSAEVVQQGLHFTPVDVAADGILENRT